MNLNFVPTPKQRQNFYSNMYYDDQSYKSQTSQRCQQKPKRKLTQEQLQSMLSRLASNHKQSIIKKQILKIQQRNQQWQNIKKTEKRSKHNHEVEERLIQNGKKKQQKLQALRRQKQSKQLQQLKPKPLITDRYLANYRPLMERVPEIIQSQKDNLQILEAKTNSKFVPTINKYSAFIGQIKNENDPLFQNRLYNNTQQALNRQNLKQKIEQEMKKQLTFKPKINSSLKKIKQQVSLAHEHIKTVPYFQQPKFQPKICKRSADIVEKSNNCFKQRLENDNNNRKVKEVELDNIRKSQYSFQPKINPNSKRLASSKKISNKIQQQDSDISYDSRQLQTIRKSKSISSIPGKLSITSSEISSKNKQKLQQLFGAKY